MLIETVEERLSEECGCPEHDIMLNHISATVHMEKNGDGEAFVDFGDWQEEWFFSCCGNIEELKRKVASKLKAMPVER